MSIKSATRLDKYTGEVDYPCLMVGETGVIVLFCIKKKGVVVVGNDLYAVGEHTQNWMMGDFRPFHGSITLSNGE